MSYTASSSRRPRHRGGVKPRRPNDDNGHELFPNARARVLDVSYVRPESRDVSCLTNDELRRQMLSTIFGWYREVDELIRNEKSQHPAGSTARTFLAKWLGDSDTEITIADSKAMSESDWMLLALSGIGYQGSKNRLGRTYVSGLLESGEIHAAVTLMLGMDDFKGAIDAYLARKRYMEALILTCLESPDIWERQAAIARQWGKWAVRNGQEKLAMRCFACTGKESIERGPSPAAQQPSFKRSERFNRPPSPAAGQRRLQSSVANSPTLKLITSSGGQNQDCGFYSQLDSRQAPLVVGSIPFQESRECTCDLQVASRGNKPQPSTSAAPIHTAPIEPRVNGQDRGGEGPSSSNTPKMQRSRAHQSQAHQKVADESAEMVPSTPTAHNYIESMDQTANFVRSIGGRRRNREQAARGLEEWHQSLAWRDLVQEHPATAQELLTLFPSTAYQNPTKPPPGSMPGRTSNDPSCGRRKSDTLDSGIIVIAVVEEEVASPCGRVGTMNTSRPRTQQYVERFRRS